MLPRNFRTAISPIVNMHGTDGTVLAEWIEKHGKKLRPLRKVLAKQKLALDFREHLRVNDGKLDNLEQLLTSELHRV